MNRLSLLTASSDYQPLPGAWDEMWDVQAGVRGLGWFDFGPSNGGAAGAGHPTPAWGRDYGDVTPLKGVIHGGGTHTLDVAVTVTRLGEET